MTINTNQIREQNIRSITLKGSVLNIFLMALKIAFGLFIRSSALIADGIHSLSDLATDFVVIISSRLSNRPADETHPYGHKKFETIASQLIAIVLVVVSFSLIWSSVRSINLGKQNYPGFMVLIVASISVVSKEILFRLTQKISRTTHSAALYANAWHHRSDALSSVAVLIAGAVGLFGWGYADQAATIAVGIMILAVAGKIFYEGFVELTEHSADKESISIIETIIRDRRDIMGFHALRTRKFGGELFVDVHILVDPHLSVFESHKISNMLEEKIQEEIPRPVNILVHIEPNHD